MSLTINLTSELESQLREAAAKNGLDTNEYIVQAVQNHLSQTHHHPPQHLPADEAHLLQLINEGTAPETWRKYNELLDKRRAETLTPDEQTELIALSDSLEECNAQRLSHLAELARLRQTSLPALMQQLGIEAPPYV